MCVIAPVPRIPRRVGADRGEQEPGERQRRGIPHRRTRSARRGYRLRREDAPLFLSSVRQSKIITGDGQPFAQAEWSVLALRADSGRRTLWATIGWVPHCANCKASDKDKTALLVFDLDRRAPSPGRIARPRPARRHDDGACGRSVYLGGNYGAVLHLKPGGRQLERLDQEGEFPSPQTPALSVDEKTL
jgi:hypothetical protein